MSSTEIHVANVGTELTFGDLPLTPAQSAAKASRWGWWYFAEHAFRNMRAWLVSVLMSSIGQVLLYLLAMGVALGTLVDANAGSVDGVSYLAFVGPAIVVSGAMNAASEENTYTIMGGFKWHRIYWGPAAAPITGSQIAIGHQLVASTRILLQTVIAWIALVLFGATSSGWSWLLIPISVLAGLAFGAPLQAYSATLKDEGFQFSMVQRFIVMPMFLFAGTFFPLSSMPGYLQWIGWISPVWHGTELSRAATYGHAISGTMIAVHLAFLTVQAVVGVWAATRIYTRRLGS